MLKLRRLRVHVAANLTRYNSTKPQTRIVASLVDRGLIRVAGTETSSFLQGLITNDMRHLDEGAGSMYAMFLNTKGRVLYDVIVYRTQESGVFLLECDVRILSALQNHLKFHRVRRKINIDDIAREIKVWAIFDPETEKIEATTRYKNAEMETQIFSSNSLKEMKNIGVYKDPRFAGLGLRVLTDYSARSNDVVANVDPEAVESVDPLSYRSYIYKLGIGEGCDDLPPGKALPLESNCDYLHGVSFHKGCYIGQELTARTHHTGVVRKRLMPVILESEGDESLETLVGNENVTNEADKVVGKLKGHVKENGLGLMRIAETLAAQTLKISGIRGKASKPVWWPQETSKERTSINKSD